MINFGQRLGYYCSEELADFLPATLNAVQGKEISKSANGTGARSHGLIQHGTERSARRGYDREPADPALPALLLGSRRSFLRLARLLRLRLCLLRFLRHDYLPMFPPSLLRSQNHFSSRIFRWIGRVGH